MNLTSTERFYSGKASGEVVIRERRRTDMLRPRPDLSGQGTGPFSWGKNGTGAAQLALALLADALCDDAIAKRFHQDFRHRVISNFPDRWTITRTRILAYVRVMQYQSDEGDSVALDAMPEGKPSRGAG
jgi:Family of unknown function (DUF6166)